MLSQIKDKKIILIFILIVIVLGFYSYKNLGNREDTNTIEEKLEIDTKEEKKSEESEVQRIKVHITGAVNKEGLVELESESRLSDAIDKAGGLKENADLDKVNLASILEDGIKVYIPKIEDRNNTENKEPSKQISSSDMLPSNFKDFETSKNTMKEKDTSKININTATQEELENLSGIGVSTAKKIVDYRKQFGRFKNIEDIKKVNGIGEAKFKKIKEFITIK